MPTNVKKTIIEAVSPLNGKVFKDVESLEDAVLPYFGPLQNFFQGQGHRDLVDWLVRSGCVVKEKGEYTFRLPVPPTPISLTRDGPGATAVPTITGGAIIDPNDGPEITYPELQMIIEIGSAANGAVSVSKYVMNEMLMDTMLKKGLIQVVSSLPMPERTQNDYRIKTSVERALAEIDQKDYYGAIGSLEIAAKAQDRNNTDQNVYTLTPLGTSIREKLSSIKIKI